MADWGIKISKVGKDITSGTATDFILNSKWATIKILQEGTLLGTLPASSVGTFTLTHNAGFFPIVMIFAELTPGSGRWYGRPFGTIAGEDTYLNTDILNTHSQANSFTLKAHNNTGSQKIVSYHYYVIGETGGTL